VDNLGLPIAGRAEPANTSDRRAGHRLLAGRSALCSEIRIVFADAGHESRKLARELICEAGWKLQITDVGNTLKITGLTWIVERSFARLGRNRRLSFQTPSQSQTQIDPAGIPLGRIERRAKRNLGRITWVMASFLGEHHSRSQTAHDDPTPPITGRISPDRSIDYLQKFDSSGPRCNRRRGTRPPGCRSCYRSVRPKGFCRCRRT
jgi:hypothetical protein